MEQDFPAWIRITHAINIIFMTLLIRSGIEILATHPRLYWNDDSKIGTEWARFTRKKMPKDKLWTALDEEEDYSSIVSMPGHVNLGLGRHWHFVSVIGWILCGLVYVVLLFATGEWLRYWPRSWAIFPEAYRNVVAYLSFQLPPQLPGQPYDAVQKLSYAAVVFLLAPFQILTGAAQSPAIEARFPWYVKAFGGRQWARSLHFLALLAFIAFIAVHVFMVIIHGFGQETAKMIFGTEENPLAATVITLLFLAGLVIFHWAATKYSLARPRSTQRLLGVITNNARKLLLHRLTSHQEYAVSDLTSEHRVNGKPPSDDAYKIMAAHGFAYYGLEVGGLVENPMTLSMEDLRTFPTWQRQRVMHNCIQGWTSIGEWGGVPLRQIVELAKPKPEARYIVLWSMQVVDRDEVNPKGEGRFYEVLQRDLAYHPQTLLALEMNGEPLPIEHGAPLRLRLETSVGFKSTKWVDRIEFVDRYDDIGQGMGGHREDNMYYDNEGEI